MGAELAKSVNRKIVFVEGLSCSGKTTVIRVLSKDNIVPILKNWPANLKNPPMQF